MVFSPSTSKLLLFIILPMLLILILFIFFRLIIKNKQISFRKSLFSSLLSLNFDKISADNYHLFRRLSFKFIIIFQILSIPMLIFIYLGLSVWKALFCVIFLYSFNLIGVLLLGLNIIKNPLISVVDDLQLIKSSI